MGIPGSLVKAPSGARVLPKLLKMEYHGHKAHQASQSCGLVFVQDVSLSDYLFSTNIMLHFS